MKKKFNEENYNTFVKLPTILSKLQTDVAETSIIDFHTVLKHAFGLLKTLDHANERQEFTLAIYEYYIVNFEHWSHSVKHATKLLNACQESIPANWFQSAAQKKRRNKICTTLNELAQSVIDEKTVSCLANANDHFDFENACFTDPITAECLQKTVVVNQNRYTDDGYHTECYNPSTAERLVNDPFTREPFVPHTISRPSIVDPVKACHSFMSKKKCEEFCRSKNYTERKLARCLIQNKHWKEDMTTYEKVRELLQFYT